MDPIIDLRPSDARGRIFAFHVSYMSMLGMILDQKIFVFVIPVKEDKWRFEKAISLYETFKIKPSLENEIMLYQQAIKDVDYIKS